MDKNGISRQRKEHGVGRRLLSLFLVFLLLMGTIPTSVFGMDVYGEDESAFLEASEGDTILEDYDTLLEDEPSEEIIYDAPQQAEIPYEDESDPLEMPAEDTIFEDYDMLQEDALSEEQEIPGEILLEAEPALEETEPASDIAATDASSGTETGEEELSGEALEEEQEEAAGDLDQEEEGLEDDALSSAAASTSQVGASPSVIVDGQVYTLTSLTGKEVHNSAEAGHAYKIEGLHGAFSGAFVSRDSHHIFDGDYYGADVFFSYSENDNQAVNILTAGSNGYSVGLPDGSASGYGVGGSGNNYLSKKDLKNPGSNYDYQFSITSDVVQSVAKDRVYRGNWITAPCLKEFRISTPDYPEAWRNAIVDPSTKTIRLRGPASALKKEDLNATLKFLNTYDHSRAFFAIDILPHVDTDFMIKGPSVTESSMDVYNNISLKLPDQASYSILMVFAGEKVTYVRDSDDDGNNLENKLVHIDTWKVVIEPIEQ